METFDSIEYEKKQTIHRWFGLTYAQYLTLPRTALQSMPGQWQEDFVKLLDEMYDKLGSIPENINTNYQVKLRQIKTNLSGKESWGPVVEDPFADYQRGRRQLEYVKEK